MDKILPIAILGAAAVGAYIAATVVEYNSHREPTSVGIRNKSRCAICNKDMYEQGDKLRCGQHVAHSNCYATLKGQGQTMCPVCHMENTF